jgi:hypothetical protein
VTGFRDQKLRITYLPWSSVPLGAVGWEVMPDRRRSESVLVYIVPSVDGSGTLEIRCHVTNAAPNPSTDELIGSIKIPPRLLGGEDA